VLYYNPSHHDGLTPCVDVYQPIAGKRRSTSYTFVVRISMALCSTPGFFAANIAAPPGATNWDPSTLGFQFLYVNSTGFTISADGPSCDPAAGQSNVYSGVGSSTSPSQASLVASPNGCDGTVVSSFSGTYDSTQVECAPYLSVPTPTPAGGLPDGATGNNYTVVVAVSVVMSLLLVCCLLFTYFYMRYRREHNADKLFGAQDAEFQVFHSNMPKDEPIVDPEVALNKSDLALWNEAKEPVATTEPPLVWDPTPVAKYDVKTTRRAKAPTSIVTSTDAAGANDKEDEPSVVVETFHNEMFNPEDSPVRSSASGSAAIDMDDDDDEEEEEDEDDDDQAGEAKVPVVTVTDDAKDRAMDDFLSQSDVTQATAAPKSAGFFAGLFSGGGSSSKRAEVEDDTEMNAFVLPEPTSTTTKPDLSLSVPVTQPEEIEMAARPAHVVDVPVPSVSAAASAWQRLAKMTIRGKTKPPTVIPYFARATTETAKPVARPAGRVNMMAASAAASAAAAASSQQPKSPTTQADAEGP